MQIPLQNPVGHVLVIEGDRHQRLRLIVKHMGKEIVCRKEDLRKLRAFMESAESSLFKGRLQLEKKADKIVVKVKEEYVGELAAGDFLQGILHSIS